MVGAAAQGHLGDGVSAGNFLECGAEQIKAVLTADAFPTDPTEWVATDEDGIGDNADPDADPDGDGVANASDAFPDDPTTPDPYGGSLDDYRGCYSRICDAVAAWL